MTRRPMSRWAKAWTALVIVMLWGVGIVFYAIHGGSPWGMFVFAVLASAWFIFLFRWADRRMR